MIESQIRALFTEIADSEPVPSRVDVLRKAKQL